MYCFQALGWALEFGPHTEVICVLTSPVSAIASPVCPRVVRERAIPLTGLISGLTGLTSTLTGLLSIHII